MWCLKCSWKSQDHIIVVKRKRDIQVFEDWIFVVHGHDKLLQNCTGTVKANAADAITMFESKDYSFFVFCGELTIIPKVADDEWKGR